VQIEKKYQLKIISSDNADVAILVPRQISEFLNFIFKKNSKTIQ